MRFSLRDVAWLGVGLHALGLVFALFAMRPGTPLVAVEERRAYLATAPLGWSLGWGTWMLCALALLAFFALLVERLDARAARAVLALATAGVAIDLLCDTGQLVLPELAHGDGFTVVERLVGAGGAVVANGLYSLAALVASRALPGRLQRGLGLAVFVCGAAMVVAGLDAVPLHLELATGPTIVAFCAWTLVVARKTAP